MRDAKQPLRGGALGLAMLIVALWGGNSVAVSFSVDTLPPVAVAGIRFAMGTIVLFGWCVVRKIPFSATRPELWMSLVAGFLLFTQISTFNVGVLWTNSTHGAMLINTFPFFVAAIEHWITKGDRLTIRSMTGMFVAAVGVAVVMLDKAPEGATGSAFIAGDLILLLSSILLAIRVVYVRVAVQRMEPGKLIFWHDIFGVAMFFAWSAATESFENAHITTASMLGLLYQGLIVAGFCFVIHASLLTRYTASQLSVFSFATPIFGVFFSILLRNEPFTLAVAIGAACVATGIWAVTGAEWRRER